MIKSLMIFDLFSVYVIIPVPGPVMVVGRDLKKECDDLVQIHDLDRIAHIVWLEV
jgi:hypothetical protein